MDDLDMGRPRKPSFIPEKLEEINEYEDPIAPIPLSVENLKKLSTEELSRHIEAILKRYAEGEYLKDIFPDYKINRWRWRAILARNPQLHKRFNSARECHIECLLERMYEIADDSTHDMLTNNHTGVKYLNKEFVARSKLRVELIQWMTDKLEKRKFYPAIEENSSVAQKASQLTQAMFKGQLNSAQCTEILRSLEQEANILKTHELEKRLESLEKSVPKK